MKMEGFSTLFIHSYLRALSYFLDHNQTKASDLKRVTKSPWKTMDKKGANTFPFHNLPPEPKKNLKGLSCAFSPFLIG